MIHGFGIRSNKCNAFLVSQARVAMAEDQWDEISRFDIQKESDCVARGPI